MLWRTMSNTILLARVEISQLCQHISFIHALNELYVEIVETGWFVVVGVATSFFYFCQ